ncbi:MAG: HAD family hydrolase, partial [Planctomycetota bacterium]
QHNGYLIYVTGRNAASAIQAIDESALPAPNALISDLGAAILQATASGQPLTPVNEYSGALGIMSGPVRQYDFGWLDEVPGIERVSIEMQSEFRLYYECKPEELQAHATEIQSKLDHRGIPYALQSSSDETAGIGRIDIVPEMVNKAFALNWWLQFKRVRAQNVIFCGDSENDLSAFCEQFQTVVVQNAADTIKEAVRRFHVDHGQSDRLHLATQCNTSGVLEGVRHFLNSP